MSDAEQRKSERRAAQGDPEAAAKLLVERLRSGELDSARVALAGWLGHDPSRRACPTDHESAGLSGLVALLADAGVEASLRVVLAMARAQPGFTHLRPRSFSFVLEVESWVAALNAGPHVSLQSLEHLVQRAPATTTAPATELLTFLRALALYPEDAGQVAQAAALALDPAPLGAESPRRLEPLLEAIREEVVPWAIGEGDPVLRRVRAWEEERDDPRYSVDHWQGNDYGEAFEALVDHYYDVLDRRSGAILLRFVGTYESGFGVATDYSGVEQVAIREPGIALVWTAGEDAPVAHPIPKRPRQKHKRRFTRQRLNYDGSSRVSCDHSLGEGCAICFGP